MKVAEVVYFLGAYARNPTSVIGEYCRRLVHLEVKLNLAIFHHISLACNSVIIEAIRYP